MQFTVYILFSQSIGRYYTGHTQDFENRILEHNRGETSSIKKGIPWKLAWKKDVASRSEAMNLESEIKKRGAKRFLEDVSRGA